MKGRDPILMTARRGRGQKRGEGRGERGESQRVLRVVIFFMNY